MSTFQQALSSWLNEPGNTQAGLAAAVGTSQAAINRYARGVRFPDSIVAGKIDRHTDGAVPFAKWQAEFLERSGLDPLAPSDEAA